MLRSVQGGLALPVVREPPPHPRAPPLCPVPSPAWSGVGRESVGAGGKFSPVHWHPGTFSSSLQSRRPAPTRPTARATNPFSHTLELGATARPKTKEKKILRKSFYGALCCRKVSCSSNTGHWRTPHSVGGLSPSATWTTFLSGCLRPTCQVVVSGPPPLAGGDTAASEELGPLPGAAGWAVWELRRSNRSWRGDPLSPAGAAATPGSTGLPVEGSAQSR